MPIFTSDPALGLPVMQLAAGADLIVVLQGTLDDLPPALLQTHNYIMLNRPDLIGHELFVFGEAADPNMPNNIAGTFGLVGEPAITGGGVPEPAALGLLTLGAVGLLRRRR